MNCILVLPADAIDSNGSFTYTDRRAEHIREILKSQPGDKVVVGRLNGRLGHGTVLSIDKKEVVLKAIFDRDPPPPLPARLIVALPRPKSMRKVVHAATVMGVKQIHFIGTWRVEKSYWQTPWLEKPYLENLLMLGLEQAVDTIMPTIQCHHRFKPFVEDKLAAIIGKSAALVAHPKAETACPRGIDYPVTLIIGPEGGFIPYEVELLEKHGVKPVTIGERILRVEEAIPAILGRLF
jgi:16S rRNA (uracil1498-N3)-methyltransferase